MDILGSPYPFTYTSTGSAASGSCTLIIPSGVYTSGVLGLDSVNGSPPSFTEDVNCTFTGQVTPTYLYHFFTSGAGDSVAHTLTAEELALINGAAGGAITLTMTGLTPFPSNGVTSTVLVDLTLYGSGGGTTVASFGCSASASDSNGYATITATLLDSNGDPTPAPVGGQIFMLDSTGGTLAPTGLYIPPGSSSGQAVINNTLSGNVTVTITAGAGPCLGQDNCVVTVYLTVPASVVFEGGTPGLCVLRFTRANMRDNIRRRLGITPDIDIYPGAIPGVQPVGEPWPTNSVLNQNIADALRLIGRRTGWHSRIDLTINVPATSADGPQWLPLTGVGAGPYQNLINRVKRCVFRDSTGQQVGRLTPRTVEDLDRARRLYDNSVSVSIPREFFIEGYQIGLLPGASAGGTLQLYADTALIGFCSDTDTLDEVPIDYEPVIEEIATWYTRAMHPDDPEARGQLQILPPQIEIGLKDIRRWLVTLNADHQYSLVPVVNRRRRR